MKRKQFSKAQNIGILKEGEAGADVTALCRDDDDDLRLRLCEPAQQRRRFSDRRLHTPPRRNGITINRKKPERLYRAKGLAVRRRKGRRRTAGVQAPAPVVALPNQRWSLDIVHDQLATGLRFRVSIGVQTGPLLGHDRRPKKTPVGRCYNGRAVTMLGGAWRARSGRAVSSGS